jgi:molybdopterin molybdotransferase
MAEGRLELWQIAIKPGKPLAFGVVRCPAGPESLFVGLPGNPVSSFVTFLLCVAPVLRALQGADPAPPAALSMRADFDWPKADKRREFLRVRLNAQGGLDLFANQSSGVLSSTVWADGLVDNPSGRVIRRGDAVRFLSLPELVSR